MLNGDGTELRQRNVPAAEERPNLEESILRRREKMRQEDREPASLMVFAVVIGIFCFLCWAGWYFILRFDDHWIIQEIEHGHVNAVRMFLAEHHELALIDKLDAHHEALIHHAVESNQPEIVSLLVSYGAKLSVRNAHGQMPLHLAVYHGWPGMVKTLVDHGAPITAADDNGREPLEWSKRLIQNNRDPDRLEVARILEEASIKRAAERVDDGLGE
eukprot:Tamp_07536.p1 GENE.Tamp_07536~~Tamp_07536.p1  ORF type:complete len:216 (-),score=40.29 Tamp_07536:1797-2444(-)